MEEKLKELIAQTDLNEAIVNIEITEVVDSLVTNLYCARCPIKKQCDEVVPKIQSIGCREMLLLYLNGIISKDGEE